MSNQYKYNYDTILEDLRKLGVKPGDVLFVHSSMKSVGNVEGGADTVLDALMEAVNEGLLILPTHTWATVNESHNIYDRDTEPACVGILPNLFMKRPGVVRSLHPTHSVAAFGKDAEAYVSGEEDQTTPCSRSGCYGRLYDLNAKILLLGCGLNRNTYMHGVEEWFGITERLTEMMMEIDIVMLDGSLKPCRMRRHFKPDGISISEYYVKMEKPLEERGILVKGKIGDADCMLMTAKETADLFTALLEKERNIFTYHGEVNV